MDIYNKILNKLILLVPIIHLIANFFNYQILYVVYDTIVISGMIYKVYKASKISLLYFSGIFIYLFFNIMNNQNIMEFYLYTIYTNVLRYILICSLILYLKYEKINLEEFRLAIFLFTLFLIYKCDFYTMLLILPIVFYNGIFLEEGNIFDKLLLLLIFIRLYTVGDFYLLLVSLCSLFIFTIYYLIKKKKNISAMIVSIIIVSCIVLISYFKVLNNFDMYNFISKPFKVKYNFIDILLGANYNGSTVSNSIMNPECLLDFYYNYGIIGILLFLVPVSSYLIHFFNKRNRDNKNKLNIKYFNKEKIWIFIYIIYYFSLIIVFRHSFITLNSMYLIVVISILFKPIIDKKSVLISKNSKFSDKIDIDKYDVHFINYKKTNRFILLFKIRNRNYDYILGDNDLNKNDLFFLNRSFGNKIMVGKRPYGYFTKTISKMNINKLEEV